MNTSDTQILDSKYHSPLKELGLLKNGLEKTEDEPESFYCSKKQKDKQKTTKKSQQQQRKTQRKMRAHRKERGASMKEHPLAKSRKV